MKTLLVTLGLCVLVSACTSGPQADAARAKARAAEGREAANRGDAAAAVDCYTAAIEADPQLPDAWYGRANANVLLRLAPETPGFSRSYEERAIADYSRAIQLDPGFADAYYNRAMLYSSRAMYRQAAEDLLSAIKFKPDDAEPHLDLAHLYEQKFEDMMPQALVHYEKYVDLGGRDRDAREKARFAKEQRKLNPGTPGGAPVTAEDEAKAQELDGRMMELFKDGKKDEALKALEELLTKYGRTRYVQGKLTALKALQSAYKKDTPK